MNIAVYSGSFNPLHNGHLSLCRYLAGHPSLNLDEVWLMVTPRNPLKPDLFMASDEWRLTMAREACQNVPGIQVSDFEMSLTPPFYSWKTLQALSSKYPHHNFKLVIGADNWVTFDKWFNPANIIADYGLIIYPRPGYTSNSYVSLPANVIYLNDAPLMDISSSYIRELIANHKDIKGLVPDNVANFIKSHKLYKEKHNDK